MELNSAALHRLRGRLPWVQFHDDGDVLWLFAGVAGIYDVEVLEGFRQQGIGTALVDAALRQAKKLGQRAAVLAADRMGLGIYSRLGFREVCKISFWKYGRMRQL